MDSQLARVGEKLEQHFALALEASQETARELKLELSSQFDEEKAALQATIDSQAEQIGQVRNCSCKKSCPYSSI